MVIKFHSQICLLVSPFRIDRQLWSSMSPLMKLSLSYWIADMFWKGQIHQYSLTVCTLSNSQVRIILALSYLNMFVWKKSVRCEDVRTVFDLFSPGYYFFTLDLKYVYYLIEIFPHYRQCLGFSWCIDSVPKYFAFTVLAFELWSASFIFYQLYVLWLATEGPLAFALLPFKMMALAVQLILINVPLLAISAVPI